MQASGGEFESSDDEECGAVDETKPIDLGYEDVKVAGAGVLGQ